MTPSERLTLLAEGNDPLLVMRLKSGFAVMSHTQFLKGYCLLLAFPEVPTLHDLPPEARIQFLYDMSLLGEAVQRATDCSRVNYSIYGNQDRFLHAHVVPRYDHELAPFDVVPPLGYPPEIRDAEEHQFDPRVHRFLQGKIQQHLQDLLEHSHSPTFAHLHHPQTYVGE